MGLRSCAVIQCAFIKLGKRRKRPMPSLMKPGEAGWKIERPSTQREELLENHDVALTFRLY
jgi:hypothetical protein